MPPHMIRIWSKCMLYLNILNTVISLLLFMIPDEPMSPGILSSALGSAGVSLWMTSLGVHKNDATYTVLSIPYVIIFVVSLFGITSYLFVAAISAAFVYLFYMDSHADA